MLERRSLVFAMVVALWPGLASAQSFLTTQRVDFTRLLAPFPVAGSDTNLAEMAELVRIEQTRTPERVASGQADVDESVFTMFGATMGPGFAPVALPLASRLFDRVGETEEALNERAKTNFARPRPFLANPDLHPMAPRSRSGSYPSGHATRSAMIGIILAAMVPERAPQIFLRMADYAESRLVMGVHYRSDIMAGRIAGTAAAAVLLDDAAFLAAYAPAREEVRRAVGVLP